MTIVQNNVCRVMPDFPVGGHMYTKYKKNFFEIAQVVFRAPPGMFKDHPLAHPPWDSSILVRILLLCTLPTHWWNCVHFQVVLESVHGEWPVL